MNSLQCTHTPTYTHARTHAHTHTRTHTHAHTHSHTPHTRPAGKGNVRIWGTQPDAIDEAEDRDRWMALLKRLDIKQPVRVYYVCVRVCARALEA